jgi:hypothetical protein
MELIVPRDIGFIGYHQRSDSTTFTSFSRTSIDSNIPAWRLRTDYRNHFYNSKEGHAYLARLEAEAEAKAKAAKAPAKG